MTADAPIASAYPSPPASLRKRGLLRVETNKRSDQELALPTGRLEAAFGKVLFERIIAKKQAALEPTDWEGETMQRPSSGDHIHDFEGAVIDAGLALHGLAALLSGEAPAASGYQLASIVDTIADRLDAAFDRFESAQSRGAAK